MAIKRQGRRHTDTKQTKQETKLCNAKVNQLVQQNSSTQKTSQTTNKYGKNR